MNPGNSDSPPGALPPTDRPWKRHEIALLGLIALLAIGLRVLLAVEAPVPIGYVYDFYHEPIIQFHQTGRLPDPDACWQCYHPPVYTLLGTAVFGAAMKATSGDLARSLWWVGFMAVPISLLFLLCSFGVIRNFVPNPRHLLPIAALMAALPLVFISSFSIESDLLCATFAVAALACYLRYRRRPAVRGSLLGMAVLAGLAMGTKYTGMVIVAVIGASMVIDIIRDREWKRMGHVAAFGLFAPLVGGWHYVENWRTHGTPIVGNQAWDNLEADEGEDLLWDHYEFFSFRWEDFLSLMGDDSPSKTLREFPAYNNSVPTSLYGQLWTDGSIFSNPWRHGLSKGLYPKKDISLRLIHALFAAGLLVIPLAGLGAINGLRRWRATLPLLLLTGLTAGLYTRWFLTYPMWMLKAKYLLALVPVGFLFCAWGLEWLQRRVPPLHATALAGVYALAILANLYCYQFAVR